MSHFRFDNAQSNSRLSFTIRWGTDRPWWRYLDIDGQPLYCLSNLCDTCPALFSLVKYTHLPIAPEELSQRLRGGLTSLSRDVVETVAQVLPKGNYAVALLNISPRFFPSRPLKDGRQTNYSWTQAGSYYADSTLIETILPLVRFEDLSPATVSSYRWQISRGARPTALAFSLVDLRCISGRFWEWHLSHLLLDGHHKLMAASKVGAEITLLSFLNLDESFCRRDWMEKTLELRYGEELSSLPEI